MPDNETEQLIDTILDSAMPMLRHEARAKFLAWVDDTEAATQSPIESQFLLALSMYHGCVNAFRKDVDRYRMVLLPSNADFAAEFSSIHKRDGRPFVVTLVQPQSPIDKYRADFLIQQSMCSTTGPKIAFKSRSYVVECDGHDFHERTPDQAERDRSRDRFMVSSGYVVFRFTGREIHRDPFACATQIKAMLFKDIRSELTAECARKKAMNTLVAEGNKDA